MLWSMLGPTLDALWVFGLDTFVQSLLLAGLGLTVARLVARGGAAMQSLVCRVTLAAILLAPAATALVPVGKLPGLSLGFRGPNDERSGLALVSKPAAFPPLQKAALGSKLLTGRDALASSRAIPAGEKATLKSNHPAAISAVASQRPIVDRPRLNGGGVRLWAIRAAVFVWLLGAIVLLVRLAMGHRVWSQIRQLAEPAEPETLALCRELADKLGLRRSPPVFRSPFLDSACVAGLFRPVVVLADDHGPNLRATLLHEVGHVARRDPAWILLARLACALLWPQPLVWLLARRLEAAAESVCDDIAIEAGSDRNDYAARLLALAELRLTPVALTGVGIVTRGSNLGRRIGRILSAARPLSTRCGRTAGLASFTCGLAALLLASRIGIISPAQAAPSESSPRPAQEPRSESVSFGGRLIDRESGEPVAGATIVVESTIPDGPPDKLPAWAGATTLRSDAEGRFTLTFTPEQVAEPRAAVTFLRVEHPDYVPLRSLSAALVNLVRDHRYGGKPFFETIRLDRGAVYTAEVVTPGGQPAAGVPYQMFRGSTYGTPLGTESREQGFWLELADGVTDDQGRIQHRVALTSLVELRIIPKECAVYTKYFGEGSRMERAPDVPLPPNLGRIELESGRVVIGRLLGLDGRPIAGQRLELVGGGASMSDRIAITDADGCFRFPPIELGSSPCCVFAANQAASYWDRGPLMTADQPVIGRVATFDRGDGPIGPLELSEVPSVRLDMRFVDAQGRPIAGRPIFVMGGFPCKTGKSDEQPLADRDAERRRQEMLAFECGQWSCRVAPDAEGRVSVQVPRGLNDTIISLDEEFNPDETLSYEFRLGPGDVADGSGAQIAGRLEADRSGIEIVVRRAPTIFARVETDDGSPVPDQTWLGVLYVDLSGWGGENPGYTPIRIDPNRFRTRRLLPGREYEFFAADGARKYRPKAIVRRTLPEGAEEEIAVVLTRRRPPLKVGDPLPEFSVTTTTGDRWNLSDYRGRFLLLYSESGNMPWIKKISELHQRVGPDRLEMLGLWVVADPDLPGKAELEAGVNWPQAMLPDRKNTSLLWDLGTWDMAGNFGVAIVLIDPEGKIRLLSFDLAEIEKAITGGE